MLQEPAVRKKLNAFGDGQEGEQLDSMTWEAERRKIATSARRVMVSSAVTQKFTGTSFWCPGPRILQPLSTSCSNTAVKRCTISG